MFLLKVFSSLFYESRVMSSRDHTYLCKALLARLNQAVAHVQTAQSPEVGLLTKL